MPASLRHTSRHIDPEGPSGSLCKGPKGPERHIGALQGLPGLVGAFKGTWGFFKSYLKPFKPFRQKCLVAFAWWLSVVSGRSCCLGNRASRGAS